MGWYDRVVLPRLIDSACGQPPMQKLRARYVPRAEGAVLEIGIGSGHNLAHYGQAATHITGLDPAAELTERASQRAAGIAQPVDILTVSGEAIPAEDNRFDSIVCTWTLCSIPDPAAALSEMHRVLKPGGALYFIEHGRSPDANVARWQRRIEPLWKRIGGGCHLTRAPDELITGAGFALEECARGYEPGPRWATWMTHGVARKPN
ncbi:MAG: class I SAM-dependent methyltransferase [Pseudomonadales bacterium]